MENNVIIPIILGLSILVICIKMFSEYQKKKRMDNLKKWFKK